MGAEGLFLAVGLPLTAGCALSLLLERLLLPGVDPFWRRPAPALLLHLGLWLSLFALGLAVVQRPWFAMGIVLACQLLVVLVSNAKYQSLQEPFIFQDFDYFLDTLRFPRLYLPFLGLGKALLAVAGFVAALYAGLTWEPSLAAGGSGPGLFLIAGTLLLLGMILVRLGARKRLRVDFDPATDLRRLGLLTSLWRYGEEESREVVAVAQPAWTRSAMSPPRPLPHLVAVQSESFFDARRLFAGIRPEVLKEYDALTGQSASFGQLLVPAWGANTVRSEFAFLSGLAEEPLGVHRFNPYRKLARRPVATLAGFLRRLGYRTVCVHPYPVEFYARDKVYPQLGFDRFLDIRSFAGAARAGPYVGDVAVAEKVAALLEEAGSQPLFLFVITMENHGPLHLEQVEEGDLERLYRSAPPPGCADLTVYLRHLRHADRMAGMIRKCLEAQPNPAWMCWFGDHVPIMPKVYAELGTPEGPTDYLLWRKGGGSAAVEPQTMRLDRLADFWLHQAGLAG